MNHRHLLIAALLVLAACSVRLVVSDDAGLQDDTAFYKLSLVWPPSVCNQPKTDCKPAVLTSFKVLGFWPFNFDGDIVQCPFIHFVDITEELRPIYEKLAKEWPDVKDYLSREANEELWRSQWIGYGNCSDWPHNPRIYFSYVLLLNHLYNNNPLNGTDIKPGYATYKARHLSEAVKSKLGVYPEIACNKLGETLQLREIRICFTWNGIRPQIPILELQDCPTSYAYKCQYDDDQVTIPLPPVFKK